MPHRRKRINDGSGGFLTIQQEYDIFKGKTPSSNTSNSSLRPPEARLDPNSGQTTDWLNKTTNVLGDYSENISDLTEFANNGWIRTLDAVGEKSQAYNKFNQVVNNNRGAQTASTIIDNIPGGKAGKALGYGYIETLGQVPKLFSQGLLGAKKEKSLLDQIFQL